MQHVNASQPADGKMARQVDDLCEQFEAKWLAGEGPRIETYLNQAEPGHRTVLLRELLRLEAGLRHERGESVAAEEYNTRFPNDTETVAAAVWMHAADDLETRRYVLLEEIGRGGMGAVYRATDLQLGRRVAVKVLLPEHRHVQEAVRRLEEESKICAGLQHPGVPPVHELGRLADGRPFLAMKLVEGTTLSEKLAQRPDPKHELAHWLGVFEQICQALAYAHAQGAIHRDLKPANVMVGAFGEVQIMDWGLAKRVNCEEGSVKEESLHTSHFTLHTSQTQSGDLLGTPAYLSPEQARGLTDCVDRRTDVFALGAMLCEILTGAPAYFGESTVELIDAAKRAELSDALQRLKHCGAHKELVKLCSDCLEAQPDRRPRDATHVSDRISAHLQGVAERLQNAELAQARAEVEQLARRRRQRLWIGSISVVLLLLIALAAGSLALAAYSRNQQTMQHQQEVRGLLVNQQVEDRLGQLTTLMNLVLRGDFEPSNEWNEAQQEREAVAALLADDIVDRSLKARATILLQSVDQEMNDRNMVARLRALWNDVMAKGLRGRREFNRYEQAFVAYGLSPQSVPPAQAAQQFDQLPLRSRQVLIDGLNRWFLLSGGENAGQDAGELPAWPFEVLTLVDDDPWRQELREAVRAKDSGRVFQLVRQFSQDATAEQPLSVILGVSQYIGDWRWESIRLLQKARKRHPNDFHVAYLLAAGMSGQADIPWNETAQACTAAVAINPQYAGAHSLLAYALARERRFTESLAAISEAIALEPDSGTHYVTKGAILVKIDRNAEAAAAYQKALELGNVPDAIGQRLGELLYRLWRYEECVEVCRQMLQQSPDDVDTHLTLGLALAKIGQPAESQAALQRGLALCDKQQPPSFQRGEFLAALGREENAVSAWRESGKRLNDPATMMAHARFLAAQGRGAEAESLFREGIAARPDDWLMLRRAADTMLEIGRFAAALDLFEQAHLRNAFRQLDTNAVGQKLVQADRLNRGAQEVDAIGAGRPLPSQGEHCLWLAEAICIPRRQYESAVRLYEQAFSLNPEFAENLDEDHSYSAIRCAALAVAEIDAAKMADGQESQQMRLRSLALQWLESRHKLIRDRIEGQGQEAKALEVRGRQPLIDVDLASLRDKQSLEGLPSAERAD